MSTLVQPEWSNTFEEVMAPYCSTCTKKRCSSRARYRSPDGSCNNLRYPLRGASITAQPRFLPPQYGDRKFSECLI